MLHPRSSLTPAHQQVLLPHGWAAGSCSPACHICSRGCSSTSSVLYNFSRPEAGTQGKVSLPSLAASPPQRRWQPLDVQVGGTWHFTAQYGEKFCKSWEVPEGCRGWQAEHEPTPLAAKQTHAGLAGLHWDQVRTPPSLLTASHFGKGEPHKQKCSPTEDRQKESNRTGQWAGNILSKDRMKWGIA